jgi:predicted methyltransferase
MDAPQIHRWGALKRTIPPLITASTARELLEGQSRVSLDLGLTEGEVVQEGGRVILPGGRAVAHEDLELIGGREGGVFFPSGDELFQVAISDGHFYKLLATGGAPTLEIDGIRMHRTSGTTPEADARDKIEALGVRRGSVLDTCTGLGYTAIACLRRGAGLVVSVELRPQVLRIAEMNPWSSDVFVDERVHLTLGDAYGLVGCLPEGFFDYLVHDPPRLARAGELYGGEFYSRLFRVVREGGGIYHYTGEPGSRYRGVDVRRGVMRRLRGAGFRGLVYHSDVLGVTCERPG